MKEIIVDGRPPEAAATRAEIPPSSRKLSSRVAVAAFAGILLFYSTTLQSTGKAIGAIHHPPDIVAGGGGAPAGDEDDDPLAESAAAEAEATGSAPEGGYGDGTQLVWPAKKPNEGRTDEGSVGVRADTGARSPYYGDIQRRHQEWLARKAQQLTKSLNLGNNDHSVDSSKTSHPEEAGDWALAGARDGGGSAASPLEEESGGGVEVERKTQDVEAGQQQRSLRGAEAEDRTEVEDRINQVNIGARLWGETYVPPIEPARRQELIDKWTGATWSLPENARQGESTRPPTGRILYVISSFDRGQRLGRKFKDKVDKMNFVLMMLDEMREACEAGFSPEVHLLAAWDPSAMLHLVQDRLFCERIGQNVPFSFQEYPHSVGNRLSAKHRIYMKDKLERFDVFLQVEDDMLLTLNHILLYQEESELLDNRITSSSKPTENTFVPGFIRVEPGVGEGEEVAGDIWVEWEIMLSRFFPTKIEGAGTYVTLRKSIPANSGGDYGGNNQGLWMATREQLRRLSEGKRCRYLDFTEDTVRGNPETHSGSIQMFSRDCGLDKVFPATHFEDFLVHHRANNKAGRRGESIPGVPIRLLREWVEQFIRDEGLLRPQN